MARKRTGKPNGKPPFKPTDEQRGEVKTLAGVGYSLTAIAEYLGIDANTVAKHFGDDIKKAPPRLLGTAYGVVAHHLKAKDLGAAKYTLSTKGRKFGWGPSVEVVLPSDLFSNCDPSRLNDQQWQMFADLLLIMGVDITDGGSDVPISEPKLIGSGG